MKKIFICSPYSHPDLHVVEIHIEYARQLCKFCIQQGHIPFASHLLFTQFLDDTDPAERSQGIKAGRVWMSSCHELWCGSGHGISGGMKGDIDFAAKALGIPVREVIRSAGHFIFADDLTKRMLP